MLLKHGVQGWLAARDSLFDNIELLPGKATLARLCLEAFAAMVMGPIVQTPTLL